MEKYIILIVVLALTVSLVGCGSKEKKNPVLQNDVYEIGVESLDFIQSWKDGKMDDDTLKETLGNQVKKLQAIKSGSDAEKAEMEYIVLELRAIADHLDDDAIVEKNINYIKSHVYAKED